VLRKMVVTRGKNHMEEEENGQEDSTMSMLVKLQRE